MIAINEYLLDYGIVFPGHTESNTNQTRTSIEPPDAVDHPEKDELLFPR